MKNRSDCPKCNSNDIIRIPGKNGAYGVGNNIPAGFLSVILVTRYLCGNCGYSEEWIDNKHDIEKLRNKFGNNNL
ncbi:MAG: hypothetical protein ACRDA5_01120 [Clostridium sp.]